MTRSNFVARRLTRTYRQTIHASPDVVFPLLCPVHEAEWLDGWHSTMLFSPTGLVEEGAVFTTPGEGEDDTVWIVTSHDVPAPRRIHPLHAGVPRVRIAHRGRSWRRRRVTRGHRLPLHRDAHGTRKGVRG